MQKRLWVWTLVVLAGPAWAEDPKHGQLSDLSQVTEAAPALCEHRVPQKVCARCNPLLVPKFKAAKDWCGEHAIPESQCFKCHPYLTFAPMPKLRVGADLLYLSKDGEEVGALEFHVVAGKVTVFDFYAEWCPPCREVDRLLFGLLNKRDDLAVRKLNVKDWKSALAKGHLGKVRSLPYLVVFGKDGKRLRTVSGFDLEAISKAIDEAATR